MFLLPMLQCGFPSDEALLNFVQLYRSYCHFSVLGLIFAKNFNISSWSGHLFITPGLL